MYIGIGPEQGHRVADRYAFGYACECCQYGEKEEQDTFWKLAKDCEDFAEFRKALVEWFYSDNWLRDETDSEESAWIIRFSDGRLLSFHGTYEEALKKARETVKKDGIGFVVS